MMREFERVCKLVLNLSLIFFFAITMAFAKESKNVITVYCNKEIGQINKKVYGNNIIAYDSTTYENRTKPYYGYSDYGAGIWDPKWNEPVKEVIDLTKGAGITIVRFPGGCGTHHYNWKNAVGRNRKHFLYGIDEFLKTCEEIGAEPIFTVSYFTGNEQDAADLVEYLNASVKGEGSRVKGEGKKNWAAERTKNRHLKPYGVKYFEIGNEVWHGNHRDIKKVLPRQYANRYLKYYEEMKKVDPTIKIGVVLWKKEWNESVLEIIKDKIDFGIVHIYPTPVWGKKLSKIPPADIFGITLSLPEFKSQRYIKDTLSILKKYTGKEVPLAVTEFNCGFVQNWPVPYRHTLGCALVNAELLKMFMKPKNDILMANYWNFVNEYWGMITNGFNGNPMDLNNPYYKRPNYYVFELYHKHFGDILLDVKVKSDGYNLGDFKNYLGERYFRNLKGDIVSGDLLRGRKWNAGKVAGCRVKDVGGTTNNERQTTEYERRNTNNDQRTTGILEIEFNNPKNTNYYHAYKTCEVEPDSYYKVSGYIKAEGLEVNKEESGFRLEIQDSRGWTKTKWAKSTKDVKGTTDWVYVEKVFKTLPDAKGIKIIARRIGEKPPLTGKALVRDVKLYKIKAKDYMVPYLSVNASKSKDGKKVYLMVVNRNLDKDEETEIVLNDFEPSGVAKVYTLWGKNVDSINERRPHNDVRIYKDEIKVKGNSFKYKFRKHSLTAVEIVGSSE